MIRNTKRTALVLACISLSAGCGIDKSISPEAGGYKESVARMGFDSSSMSDLGDYVLVEGDIMIPKNRLQAQGVPGSNQMVPQARPRFQYYTGSSPAGVSITTVNLSNASAWLRPILRDAMQQWNSLDGSAVHLTENNSTPPGKGFAIYITMMSASCGANATVAIAEFGDNSSPGRGIQFNENCSGLAYSAMLDAAVHEFGHTFSFRHSDWQQNGELNCPWWNGASHCAVQIANTPGSGGDTASVMQHIVHNWTGFSYYDRIAARTILRGFGPTPTGVLSNGHANLIWTGSADATSYNIYVTHMYIDSSLNFAYWYEYVGATAGTSFTDQTRTVTSTANCSQTFAYTGEPVGYAIGTVYPYSGETLQSNSACYVF